MKHPLDFGVFMLRLCDFSHIGRKKCKNLSWRCLRWWHSGHIGPRLINTSSSKPQDCAFFSNFSVSAVIVNVHYHKPDLNRVLPECRVTVLLPLSCRALLCSSYLLSSAGVRRVTGRNIWTVRTAEREHLISSDTGKCVSITKYFYIFMHVV